MDMKLNIILTHDFLFITVLTLHDSIESFNEVKDFLLDVELSFSRLYKIKI